MAWSPVPDDQLPVLLPEQIEITQQGGSPLGRVPEFVNTTCPKCGGPAKRETDTMDTFVDSSWYFYRYTDAKNANAPFDPRSRNTGFRSTSTSAAWSTPFCTSIYSRFWTKVMRDLGLIVNDEPARRLFTQGMVIKDGAKMSKSKGNVVSPDDMVARYGADATRMYALFAAPPDRDLDWQEDGVAGVSRFLGRVWRLATKYAPVARSAASVTADAPTGDSHSSSCASCIRPSPKSRWILRAAGTSTPASPPSWNWSTNFRPPMRNWRQAKFPRRLVRELLSSLVLLLAPFAPYLAAELWEELGGEGAVLRAPWPKSDPGLAKEDELEIPVQINGKLVTVVRVPAGADPKDIEAAALADEKVQSRTAGKTVVKVIVVPGRAVQPGGQVSARRAWLRRCAEPSRWSADGLGLRTGPRSPPLKWPGAGSSACRLLFVCWHRCSRFLPLSRSSLPDSIQSMRRIHGSPIVQLSQRVGAITSRMSSPCLRWLVPAGRAGLGRYLRPGPQPGSQAHRAARPLSGPLHDDCACRQHGWRLACGSPSGLWFRSMQWVGSHTHQPPVGEPDLVGYRDLGNLPLARVLHALGAHQLGALLAPLLMLLERRSAISALGQSLQTRQSRSPASWRKSTWSWAS